MIPDEKDEDLVDETLVQQPAEPEAGGEGLFDDEADDEIDREDPRQAADLSNVDWNRVGPALFAAFHDIMASPKAKHDNHYQIKVQDADVGAAHDALAAVTTV